MTAAIFRAAGRTLHKIRTPWCSSVSPPRRRTAPGKTLYKNCTSPLFSVPFSHINRNLTQKLQPPPLLCRFAPLIPYTKTAAAPFLRTSTRFDSAQGPAAPPDLTQKLHAYPIFPHVFPKSAFFALNPQKSPPSPSLLPRSSCFLAPADPSEPGSLHKNASLRPPSPLVRMMEQDRKKFWRLLHGCV